MPCTTLPVGPSVEPEPPPVRPVPEPFEDRPQYDGGDVGSVQPGQYENGVAVAAREKGRKRPPKWTEYAKNMW